MQVETRYVEIQRELATIEDELLSATEYVRGLLEYRKSVLLLNLEMHELTQEDYNDVYADEEN
ncbi:hypothetical protein [Paenibacillus elgii]|uniref:hypothetical protein n=1 Tax=Paenibacillus elgii TaxID=189691 RepID=UPI00203F3E84|nr:hypothetical protein [Paenibacillus elgii]MCM3273076.1 hypothetical protein [Paenibacillus elgii]